MKNSIEKIYNKVIEIGKIRLDTLVVNGKKIKDDMRRDALYYNDFDSQKYSNASKLDQLTISNDSYLCLSYKGYNEDQKFESIEVWMNSKNIENFREFVITAYDEFVEKIDAIYGKNKVNQEYEEFVIETGYNEDGSGFGNIDAFGHKAYVYPEVCFTNETEKPYNGIVLCIEDKDGNVYGQEMSISTFGSIANILQNYDLLKDSRDTAIEGMLYQIISCGSITTSSSVGRGSSNARPLKPRPGARKPLVTRPSLSELTSKIDSSNEDDEDEVIEETPKKTVKKKPTTKKTNKVGIDDILNESDDIEIDLDDEEGEEY